MRRYGALLVFISAVALAQTTAFVDQAFLYLPDAEMKRRISDQDEFIAYAGNVMDAIVPTISSLPASEPVSFGLIVTVRQGRESKVWFSVKSGSLSEVQRDHISAALEAIHVPEVNFGVVPVAYAVLAWGATDRVTDFPVAPEWAEHIVGGMQAVDVIERAWKSD
jgi:hypothetical protein